jgi:hypothetical protein
LLYARNFSEMSSDIVYQMEWFNNLLRSKPEPAKVIAAKAKKDEITKRCAKEQTDVDKEIIDAKAESVASEGAVNGAPVKESGSEHPTTPVDNNANQFAAIRPMVPPEVNAPMEGPPDGGKSKKKKGGKSNKKKFSNKRKGGKRAKSQKKRR